MQHLPTTRRSSTPSRWSVVALAVAGALALSACSKGNQDVAAPTAAASAAEAPVVATAPVTVAPAPATAPTVVAQNESRTRQYDRDYARHDRDERALPPRSDRDGDYVPPPADARRYDDRRHEASVGCPQCGVVASFDTVQIQGQADGVGAVAGGVGGALLGNRLAGRNNHTLGGIVGAVGGGLIGNAVEKHERASVAYDVHVRMEDGTMRTVRQSTPPSVGAQVLVEADGLHARS